MGQLVSSHIPNLIGGVSQQPWPVRLPTQCEEQINCYGTAVDFLRRRPATTHVAALPDMPAGSMAVHAINRDATERYVVTAASDGSVNVFDLAGHKKSVAMQGSAPAYLTSANPKHDLRFLTLNDYTILLNRKVVARMLPDPTPTRAPEAIVFIKQASYNTTYRLCLNGAWYQHTTLSGITAVGSPPHELSSESVANALAAQLPAGVWAVQTTQSTIWIRRTDGGDFTVQVADSRSNTHIMTAKSRVQRFSDLPACAPRDFVLEVTGDSNSSFDNYFVKFKPANDGAHVDEGVWIETVKPGIPHKLDPATMPHALVRNADGTFTCKPLDWEPRICGDEDSAPDPSFVGRPISGMFFYRNRLSFLSWENVVMSKTGEFFNFFVSTVTTLLDNDVIDVAASHTRPTNLDHAAVFSGGLLLFSEAAQFTLEHDTILSNATVSVKPVTEFEASMLVAPVSSGKTVFFATDKGAWAGVREYFTLPDVSEQNDAADVSAHVPRYIAGDITDLVCSPGEDALLVLTTSPRSVWVYKYFWNGSEKIQSSWSRWDMGGDVLGAVFIATRAYFVMRYDDGSVCIECLEFESKHKDPYLDFEVCLDRKITEASLIREYDPVTDSTAVTLPYALNPDAEWVFVVRPTAADPPPGSPKPGTVIPAQLQSPTVARLQGDHAQTPLFGGVPFLSSYTFSPFALRDANNRAILSGRLQMRGLTLDCQDTGCLEILVTPLYRPTSRHVFTGKRLGHGHNLLGTTPIHDGEIHVPILSRNTRTTITARSDSWLPWCLVNATWEGFYTARSQTR